MTRLSTTAGALPYASKHIYKKIDLETWPKNNASSSQNPKHPCLDSRINDANAIYIMPSKKYCQENDSGRVHKVDRSFHDRKQDDTQRVRFRREPYFEARGRSLQDQLEELLRKLHEVEQAEYVERESLQWVHRYASTYLKETNCKDGRCRNFLRFMKEALAGSQQEAAQSEGQVPATPNQALACILRLMKRFTISRKKISNGLEILVKLRSEYPQVVQEDSTDWEDIHTRIQTEEELERGIPYLDRLLGRLQAKIQAEDVNTIEDGMTIPGGVGPSSMLPHIPSNLATRYELAQEPFSFFPSCSRHGSSPGVVSSGLDSMYTGIPRPKLLCAAELKGSPVLAVIAKKHKQGPRSSHPVVDTSLEKKGTFSEADVCHFLPAPFNLISSSPSGDYLQQPIPATFSQQPPRAPQDIPQEIEQEGAFPLILSHSASTPAEHDSTTPPPSKRKRGRPRGSIKEDTPSMENPNVADVLRARLDVGELHCAPLQPAVSAADDLADALKIPQDTMSALECNLPSTSGSQDSISLTDQVMEPISCISVEHREASSPNILLGGAGAVAQAFSQVPLCIEAPMPLSGSVPLQASPVQRRQQGGASYSLERNCVLSKQSQRLQNTFAAIADLTNNDNINNKYAVPTPRARCSSSHPVISSSPVYDLSSQDLCAVPVAKGVSAVSTRTGAGALETDLAKFSRRALFVDESHFAAPPSSRPASPRQAQQLQGHRNDLLGRIMATENDDENDVNENRSIRMAHAKRKRNLKKSFGNDSACGKID